MVLHSKIDLEIAEKFWFKDDNLFFEWTFLNKNAIFLKNCHNSFQYHQNSKCWGCFGKFRKFAARWAQEFFKIDLKMTEIIDPKVGNPLYEEAKSVIKMILSKSSLYVCSAVTWSIFHLGSKVRWVLKSSSPGLLKNGQKFFCMWYGTWENNKITV